MLLSMLKSSITSHHTTNFFPQNSQLLKLPDTHLNPTSTLPLRPVNIMENLTLRDLDENFQPSGLSSNDSISIDISSPQYHTSIPPSTTASPPVPCDATQTLPLRSEISQSASHAFPDDPRCKTASHPSSPIQLLDKSQQANKFNKQHPPQPKQSTTFSPHTFHPASPRLTSRTTPLDATSSVTDNIEDRLGDLKYIFPQASKTPTDSENSKSTPQLNVLKQWLYMYAEQDQLKRLLSQPIELHQYLTSLLSRSDYASTFHFSHEYITHIVDVLVASMIIDNNESNPTTTQPHSFQLTPLLPQATPQPKPSWLQQHYTSIPIYIFYAVYTLIVMCFSLLYILKMYFSPYYAVLSGWILLAKAMAGVIYINSAIVFLPACHSLTSYLQSQQTLRRYIPINTIFNLHKICGWSMTAAGLIHTFAHLAGTFRILRNVSCVATHNAPFCGYSYVGFLFTSIPGVTGIILLILFAAIAFTSRRTFRHKHFATFFTTHHLFILITIVLCIHGTGQFVQAPHCWRYLLGSFVIYCLDKLYRVFFVQHKFQFKIARAKVFDFYLANNDISKDVDQFHKDLQDIVKAADRFSDFFDPTPIASSLHNTLHPISHSTIQPSLESQNTSRLILSPSTQHLSNLHLVRGQVPTEDGFVIEEETMGWVNISTLTPTSSVLRNLHKFQPPTSLIDFPTLENVSQTPCDAFGIQQAIDNVDEKITLNLNIINDQNPHDQSKPRAGSQLSPADFQPVQNLPSPIYRLSADLTITQPYTNNVNRLLLRRHSSSINHQQHRISATQRLRNEPFNTSNIMNNPTQAHPTKNVVSADSLTSSPHNGKRVNDRPLSEKLWSSFSTFKSSLRQSLLLFNQHNPHHIAPRFSNLHEFNHNTNSTNALSSTQQRRNSFIQIPTTDVSSIDQFTATNSSEFIFTNPPEVMHGADLPSPFECLHGSPLPQSLPATLPVSQTTLETLAIAHQLTNTYQDYYQHNMQAIGSNVEAGNTKWELPGLFSRLVMDRKESNFKPIQSGSPIPQSQVGEVILENTYEAEIKSPQWVKKQNERREKEFEQYCSHTITPFTVGLMESFIILEIVPTELGSGKKHKGDGKELRYKFRPGQYAKLTIPEISHIAHPFTITGSPLNDDSVALFLIKVAGPWTQSLRTKILTEIAHNQFFLTLEEEPASSQSKRISQPNHVHFDNSQQSQPTAPKTGPTTPSRTSHDSSVILHTVSQSVCPEEGLQHSQLQGSRNPGNLHPTLPIDDSKDVFPNTTIPRSRVNLGSDGENDTIIVSQNKTPTPPTTSTSPGNRDTRSGNMLKSGQKPSPWLINPVSLSVSMTNPLGAPTSSIQSIMKHPYKQPHLADTPSNNTVVHENTTYSIHSHSRVHDRNNHGTQKPGHNQHNNGSSHTSSPDSSISRKRTGSQINLDSLQNTNCSQLLAVAGGVGITPFASNLTFLGQALHILDTNSPWSFSSANRGPSTDFGTAFKDDTKESRNTYQKPTAVRPGSHLSTKTSSNDTSLTTDLPYSGFQSRLLHLAASILYPQLRHRNDIKLQKINAYQNKNQLGESLSKTSSEFTFMVPTDAIIDSKRSNFSSTTPFRRSSILDSPAITSTLPSLSRSSTASLALSPAPATTNIQLLDPPTPFNIDNNPAQAKTTNHYQFLLSLMYPHQFSYNSSSTPFYHTNYLHPLMVAQPHNVTHPQRQVDTTSHISAPSNQRIAAHQPRQHQSPDMVTPLETIHSVPTSSVRHNSENQRTASISKHANHTASSMDPSGKRKSLTDFKDMKRTSITIHQSSNRRSSIDLLQHLTNTIQLEKIASGIHAIQTPDPTLSGPNQFTSPLRLSALPFPSRQSLHSLHALHISPFQQLTPQTAQSIGSAQPIGSTHVVVGNHTLLRSSQHSLTTPLPTDVVNTMTTTNEFNPAAFVHSAYLTPQINENCYIRDSFALPNSAINPGIFGPSLRRESQHYIEYYTGHSGHVSSSTRQQLPFQQQQQQQQPNQQQTEGFPTPNPSQKTHPSVQSQAIPAASLQLFAQQINQQRRQSQGHGNLPQMLQTPIEQTLHPSLSPAQCPPVQPNLIQNEPNCDLSTQQTLNLQPTSRHASQTHSIQLTHNSHKSCHSNTSAPAQTEQNSVHSYLPMSDQPASQHQSENDEINSNIGDSNILKPKPAISAQNSHSFDDNNSIGMKSHYSNQHIFTMPSISGYGSGNKGKFGGGYVYSNNNNPNNNPQPHRDIDIKTDPNDDINVTTKTTLKALSEKGPSLPASPSSNNTLIYRPSKINSLGFGNNSDTQSQQHSDKLPASWFDSSVPPSIPTSSVHSFPHQQNPHQAHLYTHELAICGPYCDIKTKAIIYPAEFSSILSNVPIPDSTSSTGPFANFNPQMSQPLPPVHIPQPLTSIADLESVFLIKSHILPAQFRNTGYHQYSPNLDPFDEQSFTHTSTHSAALLDRISTVSTTSTKSHLSGISLNTGTNPHPKLASGTSVDIGEDFFAFTNLCQGTNDFCGIIQKPKTAVNDKSNRANSGVKLASSVQIKSLGPKKQAQTNNQHRNSQAHSVSPQGDPDSTRVYIFSAPTSPLHRYSRNTTTSKVQVDDLIVHSQPSNIKDLALSTVAGDKQTKAQSPIHIDSYDNITNNESTYESQTTVKFNTFDNSVVSSNHPNQPPSHSTASPTYTTRRSISTFFSCTEFDTNSSQLVSGVDKPDPNDTTHTLQPSSFTTFLISLTQQYLQHSQHLLENSGSYSGLGDSIRAFSRNPSPDIGPDDVTNVANRGVNNDLNNNALIPPSLPVSTSIDQLTLQTTPSSQLVPKSNDSDPVASVWPNQVVYFSTQTQTLPQVTADISVILPLVLPYIISTSQRRELIKYLKNCSPPDLSAHSFSTHPVAPLSHAFQTKSLNSSLLSHYFSSSFFSVLPLPISFPLSDPVVCAKPKFDLVWVIRNIHQLALMHYVFNTLTIASWLSLQSIDSTPVLSMYDNVIQTINSLDVFNNVTGENQFNPNNTTQFNTTTTRIAPITINDIAYHLDTTILSKLPLSLQWLSPFLISFQLRITVCITDTNLTNLAANPMKLLSTLFPSYSSLNSHQQAVISAIKRSSKSALADELSQHVLGDSSADNYHYNCPPVQNNGLTDTISSISSCLSTLIPPSSSASRGHDDPPLLLIASIAFFNFIQHLTLTFPFLDPASLLLLHGQHQLQQLHDAIPSPLNQSTTSSTQTQLRLSQLLATLSTLRPSSSLSTPTMLPRYGTWYMRFGRPTLALFHKIMFDTALSSSMTVNSSPLTTSSPHPSHSPNTPDLLAIPRFDNQSHHRSSSIHHLNDISSVTKTTQMNIRTYCCCPPQLEKVVIDATNTIDNTVLSRGGGTIEVMFDAPLHNNPSHHHHHHPGQPRSHDSSLSSNIVIVPITETIQISATNESEVF